MKQQETVKIELGKLKPSKKGIFGLFKKKEKKFKPEPILSEELAVEPESQELTEIDKIQQEIENKTKLLQAKIEEEKARIQREKEEAKKKELEAKKPKESSKPNKVIEQSAGISEVPIFPDSNSILFRCPQCHAKIKRSKVSKDEYTITQDFGCKKCGFVKRVCFRL